LFIGFVGL